jgi:hypothetical protein
MVNSGLAVASPVAMITARKVVPLKKRPYAKGRNFKFSPQDCNAVTKTRSICRHGDTDEGAFQAVVMPVLSCVEYATNLAERIGVVS